MLSSSRTLLMQVLLRSLLMQVLLRSLLMQVLMSSHVLMMEPEIDWSSKIARISESSLDTHIPPDITFKVNEDEVEHKIGAHKIVMGMVSPVFNKLLIKMDALDNRTKELFVKGTTYGAFNIMKNAVYGMVPMRNSLKGKSVKEVFSIYDLVTRYQIPELRQVVQNHVASFPLTDDTVLEVAAGARDHLQTYEKEARNLLVRCAAYLKPKFKTVQSVLEYFAEHTENKEILHELLVLTKDNQDKNLPIRSTVAIDCRQEPCQNEVGFVPNRGQGDGYSGGRDGQGFREGLAYGGGRDDGGYRDSGGHNRGRDNSGYGRGRDNDGYGGAGDDNEYGGGGYVRVEDNRDYGGDRSRRYGGVINDGSYRESGGHSRGRDDSVYSRGRDYDRYGGAGDNSEYGGGGYGRVGDNRDYEGERRYGGVINVGGYRGGGGHSKGRDNSEYSGGNGYRGSQDKRGYTVGGEYGSRSRGKGEYDQGRDGGGYRKENVYGGSRDNGGDRGKGGYGGKYGEDIRGKDVRGYGRSTDSGDFGGGRYNGGFGDGRDKNGGGFKGGRGRDGGEFIRGDYGRNEHGIY